MSARVREAGKHIAHLNEKAVPYVPPHVQSLCFGVQKVVNLRESVRNKLFSANIMTGTGSTHVFIVNFAVRRSNREVEVVRLRHLIDSLEQVSHGPRDQPVRVVPRHVNVERFTCWGRRHGVLARQQWLNRRETTNLFFPPGPTYCTSCRSRSVRTQTRWLRTRPRRSPTGPQCRWP